MKLRYSVGQPLHPDKTPDSVVGEDNASSSVSSGDGVQNVRFTATVTYSTVDSSGLATRRCGTLRGSGLLMGFLQITSDMVGFGMLGARIAIACMVYTGLISRFVNLLSTEPGICVLFGPLNKARIEVWPDEQGHPVRARKTQPRAVNTFVQSSFCMPRHR